MWLCLTLYIPSVPGRVKGGLLVDVVLLQLNVLLSGSVFTIFLFLSTFFFDSHHITSTRSSKMESRHGTKTVEEEDQLKKNIY